MGDPSRRRRSNARLRKRADRLRRYFARGESAGNLLSRAVTFRSGFDLNSPILGSHHTTNPATADAPSACPQLAHIRQPFQIDTQFLVIILPVLNTTQKQFFFTAPATNSKFISVQLIKRKILAMGLLGLICCGSLQAASELVPTQLLCEYLTNPLGIDEPKPRLSWQCTAIDPTSRGLTQDSYQVVVASSSEMLAKDQGDLWDSGKVVSGQSIHVPYAGKPLVSLQRCFWKVRGWTPKGEAWSQPSAWTMGFLKEEEWNAKWIGASSRSAAFLEGAEWIWTPEKEAGIFYPPGER